MKFFLDTADIKEIETILETGLLDGVTTNPSHVAKQNRPFIELVKEIAGMVPGPVSAEVTATNFDDMLRQAHMVAAIAPNVNVKVPLIAEGIKLVKKLTEEGIKTNVTLCFTPTQALCAAKVGATYISPFIGRLDDIGQEGMEGIRQIRKIYDNYGFQTQILTASARSVLHIRDAALAGSDVVTMPFATFGQLLKHPLTDSGLQRFTDDFNKIPAELLGDWNAVSSEKKGA
jgi:transaldolase